MRAYDDPLYLIESIPPEDEDDPIREFLAHSPTLIGFIATLLLLSIVIRSCITGFSTRVESAGAI